MRLLFLTRTLRGGGAERQLTALATGLHARGHHVAVAVLYPGGRFEDELRRAGIALHPLNKRGRWDVLPFALALVRVVRRERPDVLHSYLGSPNIAAATLRPFFRGVKVVWGLRSSNVDFSGSEWIHGAATRLEGLISPFADAVISNSEAARRKAARFGIDDRKVHVVPNGIDCERFRPDPEAGAALRREWGVAPGVQLVGLVARLDPMKDHPTFLRAAAQVAAARPNVQFVCVGTGPKRYAAELSRLADQLGLHGRLTWAGERAVSRAEYSAFDVAVLSSRAGEGFPNTLAEAMACGRPVVATESGDVGTIIGSTGQVVPPGDADAFARAILAVLDRIRASAPELGAATRERIASEYSVDALVRRTCDVLERVRAAA